MCVDVSVCVSMALAQLTDKMDPMYIIPKVQSEPGNEAHFFFGVSNFGGAALA